MSDSDNPSKILPRIYYEGGSWLIWTANEVEELYKLAKIVGCATLTAPHFPKQSNELSLPFELMPCEVRWCYDNHYCSLYVIKPKFELTTVPIPQLPSLYDKQIKIDDESEYENEPIEPPEIDSQLYETYCILKKKGFWIYDGQNYGCDFSIYKDEPWKCHSYALVWCEKEFFNTRQLIQHVRIAESTKKKAIAAIASEDGSINLVDFSRYKMKDDHEDDIIIEEDDDHFL